MSYTTNYCLEYDLYLDRSAACGICVENAYFLQFLLLLSLIPVSALTSAWLVAKFVYEPHMRQVENEKDWSDYEEEEEEEEEVYEDKYCLDFVNKNDEKKNHDSLMVQETTPDGSVFMKYNEENESFDYWCDNKEIKYVYLEVVARKYCTMFGCPEIYIDRGKEIQRQKELEKQAEEQAAMNEEDKEEVDSDDELFAKLKKPQEVKKSVEKKKSETAAVRANKYKRIGKISEMVLLKSIKPVAETKKKMTFSDWVSFSKNTKTV